MGEPELRLERMVAAARGIPSPRPARSGSATDRPAWLMAASLGRPWRQLLVRLTPLRAFPRA